MFAPGACTPSDIENILLNGSVDFQYFPAEQSGGVERLKAMIEPFDHLPLDIFVKGGITPEKMPEYLKIPQVAAVSVDWIVTPEYIQAKNWDKITELAIEAKKLSKPGL
jgi:2-dehydro-3-deoxyphosphogluconate aldolase/(4S)-4-hydroxy-2-oxoglutarate aldolase